MLGAPSMRGITKKYHDSDPNQPGFFQKIERNLPHKLISLLLCCITQSSEQRTEHVVWVLILQLYWLRRLGQVI